MCATALYRFVFCEKDDDAAAKKNDDANIEDAEAGGAKVEEADT